MALRFFLVFLCSCDENLCSIGKIYTELPQPPSQVVDSMRWRLVFVLPLPFLRSAARR